MNNVSLIGRLTKAPELKSVGDDKQVCNFTLAVENLGQDAIFINCQAWGKTAEFVQKFFDKGVRIGLQGRLNVRSWEKDGRKQFVTEVVAEKVFFADGKREPNQAAPIKKQESFEVYDVNGTEELPF